ncbi:hypothetical protein BpHYR1_016801 [Brachionus plicatilis]|uniref:Uncharacterized protein n=1 Tax=Brachionus plicatilis TaxID=10195 RepID=A0A3M7RLB6_BRAPC|nr:hypothetical protein BpHYR1_016801 [Brachionus plicatilis]
MVDELWKWIPKDHLKASWHKLNLNLEQSVIMEEIDLSTVKSKLEDLGLKINDIELSNWLNNDSNCSGYNLMSDDQIVEQQTI